ncbi:MAG: hypothetical protein KGI89_15155, partial [Euryarchaeota archaeon]|nr:hypothetical protein [Euryarchaeota archaeon]
LDAWFAADETPWHAWYLRFEKTRDRLYTTWMRGGVNAPVSWAQARAKLSTVFRNARLRIVNSDEEVGSTLDFSRGMDGTGKPLLPRDVYTIVLGGSRLSRGITIDGLCVSYFARWAPVPKEDTILQMSRWFGYRGKHLEFCRLFVSPPAFRYLDSMHEHDRELRLALVEMMEKRLAPADATLLLRANPHSLPTSKLGAATKVDIKFAGKGQVFRGVECGPLALKNQEVAVAFVREVRSRAPSEIRRLDGTPPRGWISEKWTLLEVADWLDRLQYTGHNPDPSQRPIRNHYRPVDPSRPCALRFENPSTDPYEMAAYLRAWDADDALPKPTINAGFATGRMDHDTAPFNFPLADRTIMEDDMLVGSWEGRGNGWEGDARFDGITSAMLKKGTASRLQGAPGLLLLYIIHKNATGRGDFGKTRPAHTPTFGISLPAGGPTLRWIVPG